MIELSNERINQILHEETQKKEDLDTILRSIYTRYMRLFEKYFSDIDALNDNEIAELRKYHEETRSLIKYYYMDIPLDICMEIREFEDTYSNNLLGPGWHNYISDNYDEFKENNSGTNKSDEALKADYKKHILTEFYDAMDEIFRDGFSTSSKLGEQVVSGIGGLLFGKDS